MQADFLSFGMLDGASPTSLTLMLGGVFLLALAYVGVGLTLVASANAALSLLHNPDTPAR